MLKWLIALLLVVLLLGVARPRLAAWLPRLRLGRLPGDLRFRLRGREYLFPFASVILLSLLALVLMRFL
ncbi:MAG: DUF2905 family protein [Sulfurisoma sp.]|nr:DUF2905 family protein [Sulfurisoma sp.]